MGLPGSETACGIFSLKLRGPAMFPTDTHTFVSPSEGSLDLASQIKLSGALGSISGALDLLTLAMVDFILVVMIAGCSNDPDAPRKTNGGLGYPPPPASSGDQEDMKPVVRDFN